MCMLGTCVCVPMCACVRGACVCVLFFVCVFEGALPFGMLAAILIYSSQAIFVSVGRLLESCGRTGA